MIRHAKHKQRKLFIEPGNVVLETSFFDRDAAIVARDLVGKMLVRERAGVCIRLVITETEAYLGSHDLASHSARGRTARTEVMFGPPGQFYVYLIYGMHWMLNIVTAAVDQPCAVLIRGAGPLSGPGKLSRELDITRELNGALAQPSSGLWFEHADSAKSIDIETGPRVGVDYAGPMWSQRKLRFMLKADKRVSQGEP